jgi:hypothetical protein
VWVTVIVTGVGQRGRSGRLLSSAPTRQPAGSTDSEMLEPPSFLQN